MKTTNRRSQRAREMIESNVFCSQLDRETFRVQSQTNTDTIYSITKTETGLVCECPDHQKRGADCKHIKVVLEKLRANRFYANEEMHIMQRSNFKLCKYCDSGNIVKKGFRKTKSGNVQKYGCRDCKKTFTANFGFERMKNDPQIITRALQWYYQGLSTRDIASSLEMMGIDVSHVAVYRWITGYSKMIDEYVSGIVPRLGGRPSIRADEVFMRVAGDQKYLFASMDDDTRYFTAAEMAETKYQHDADNLLHMTRRQIGDRDPAHFITDGLPAYAKSSTRVFGKNTRHIVSKGIRSNRKGRLGNVTIRLIHPDNNKMERLNGEIRDREKVFRGLKRMDTPIIVGMKTYYNYAKKHIGLDGKTPAEAALIKVDGRDKWHTLIQNASLHKRQG